MKKFTTYSEIENLCEAMIKDFMKRKHYTNAHCVDIEAFVTEYLGIPIVYETFAEPDLVRRYSPTVGGSRKREKAGALS